MKSKSNRIELPCYQTPLLLCTGFIDTFKLQHQMLFESLTPSQLKKLFFVNQSWRLTSEGHISMTKKYKNYQLSNPANSVITGKIVLKMDECVNGPWYFTEKRVVVFDPTIYFELTMVNGDLSKFVDFKSPIS